MGFLNIHPDNVQSDESQATQAGAFYQMGFLGWEFHCVFPDNTPLRIFFFTLLIFFAKYCDQHFCRVWLLKKVMGAQCTEVLHTLFKL